MTATAPGTRLIVIDAARGLAVMGILLINIMAFAMPEAAYVNPTVWNWGSVADKVTWTISQLLFEGRMRGLFALLFGASVLLVMDRAAAAGENAVAVHLRRMAVLALIGLAHMILVWDGDILFHYALLGAVIWVARGWRVRTLVMVAIVALTLHTLYWSALAGGAVALEFAASRPGADPSLLAKAAEVRRLFPGPGSPETTAEVARMTGNYAGIFAHRLDGAPTLPIEFLKLMGGETLGYMLLGMALFRSGFFTGGWEAARLRRLAVRGYAIGLPALALFTSWSFASGFDPIVTFAHFAAWPVPFRVLVALAHLGVAVLVLERFRTTPTVARIAAVGRMALTNYLATSVAMTTLFYGYGLGLYGQVARPTLYLIAFAMWAAMLLWSQPWLARYRFGPIEWLWRSLARGRAQPLLGPAR